MKKTINIKFLGATGTVTGSKFLIETDQKNIMIDCGMFQGLKELRELNWQKLPIDAAKVDLVLLTHGHLDHVGYLPRFVKEGFRGQIIATEPTLSIAEIVLKDSGRIHEEDAERAKKEGYSKHENPKPFYTLKDAEETVKFFKSADEDDWISLSDDIKIRFMYNGHIIGSTFIELDIYGKRLVFSGDIGRQDDILLRPPKKPEKADYVFMETTYGDRLHPKEDLPNFFEDIIKTAYRNHGNIIIPSFSVERLQVLMYLLWHLQKEKEIPEIAVYADSPMGNNVLHVFENYPQWHKLPIGEFKQMLKKVNIVTSYRETWETIDIKKSKIVIAGSGMVTGGRVLTYLKQMIDEPETFVVLVGYQAEGTRGRQLLEGTGEIKFFGKYYPVKAKIESIHSLSAHADQGELLDWLSDIKEKPQKVFLIHGEPSAQDVFRVKLKDRYAWDSYQPKRDEEFTIYVD
jgi:metallo-beta-lactamase family protein